MTFSDVAKGWTDTLSTFFVGALAFVLPTITEVATNGSLISISLGGIAELFSFSADFPPIAGVVLSVLFFGGSVAIGSIITQFGELLSILPDLRSGRDRIVQRHARSSEDATLTSVFLSAYASFRLLTGIGGLLVLLSLPCFIQALTQMRWQLGLIGLMSAICGIAITMRFARYSFTYLDWILFGDFRE